MAEVNPRGCGIQGLGFRGLLRNPIFKIGTRALATSASTGENTALAGLASDTGKGQGVRGKG